MAPRYDLFDDVVELDTGRDLTDVDYAVSALIIFAIAAGLIYLARKFFTKVS